MISRICPMDRLRLVSAAVVLIVSTGLAGCDRQEPASPTAADNPSQFAAAREHSSPSESRADDGARPLAPGVGMRQGHVHGLSAGHLGLQMVLGGVVSEDGELLYDRLDSSMNMDLIEEAIETYSSTALPSEPHEQLVCYCNAYNANALAILTMLAMDTGGALLTDDEPIDRVRFGEPGSARDPRASALSAARERFDAQPVLVANETMSMRELREVHILGFSDPRVLAYLIDVGPTCRAPREALWPRHLDEQLNALCIAWVNGSSLTSLHDGEVQLSHFLQQYAAAFEGDTYGGVLGFLRRYAQAGGPLATALGGASADEPLTGR